MLLVALALAAEPDRSWTGVGVQGVFSPAVAQGELDLVLSERLVWTLSEGERFTTQARLDARFTVDPFRSTHLETSRVRALGVHLAAEGWQVDLGRAPVLYGGPRMVDGVQALRVGPVLSAGLWLGAAPDLWTTRPAPRFGGGPVLVATWERHQVSVVGEALAAPSAGGVALDRAGVLVQTRSSLNRTLFVDSRLDLQAAQSGTPLADAAVFARWQPLPGLRVDAFYDAHSTWRYLATADRDPAIQRFAARSQDLGLSEDIPTDELDPTLYQLGGLGLRASRGPWSAGMALRGRYHASPDRRYARLGPQVGLQLSDSLLLTADAFGLYASEAWRYEVGVTAWYTPDSDWAVDGTARLLVRPVDDQPGFYVDAFVNRVLPDQGVAVAAGAFVHGQDGGNFTDTGVGGLARLTWRTRGR